METSAENTSPESEIALLPVIHTVFFSTSSQEGLVHGIVQAVDGKKGQKWTVRDTGIFIFGFGSFQRPE